MEQWIDGLSWDWCISRQRYFGVPFPIWYSKRAGEEGKVIVASPDQLPVNPLVDLPEGYSKDEIIPEADVMDTWATSSVSPQLNSKAITNEYAVDYKRHQSLFPADLRPQAHEIIRTWAFYTMVKAYLHENTVPWKNLMISGWCLAADKSKMSKSKGNVITPVDMIEDKGADVVRFWASTSRLGADTAYSEDVLKVGRKLVTKLWNATRFAALHLEKIKQEPTTAALEVASGIISQPLDLWILTQLHHAVAKATKEFERYEYCNAREVAEGFFWNDFCDNYLELVKVRVYGEAADISEADQRSAIHTIYHCLDGILRLFAPIVPHITEELYLHIFETKAACFGGSIHGRNTWPVAADYPADATAQKQGASCISILNTIRKMKAERNVSLKWPLEWVAITKGEGEINLPEGILKDLRYVSNAKAITLKEPAEIPEIISASTEDKQCNVAALFATKMEENTAQG
jgi:valyl-tRNA synthetase